MAKFYFWLMVPIFVRLSTVLLVLIIPTIAHSGTLEEVKKRGYLRCGVGHNDFGFAAIDENGVWQGFDVDYCRAIASAVLLSPTAVQFIPVDSQTRLPALMDGEIDVLFRTTTWTFGRDVGLPIQFAAIVLFDQQRVIASAQSGISSLAQAEGETICVNVGTTSLDNITEFVAMHKISINILKLETQEGRWNAFLNGRCNLMTSDYFDLYAGTRTLAPKPDEIVFLADVLSDEPLSVAVRDDDVNWLNIVRWVVNVTILAEHVKLTKKTLALPSVNSTVLRLLGEKENTGKHLNLDQHWAKRVIKSVGNYGDIFNRNLGKNSSFGIIRGANEIWSNGGLIYAPPFR